MRPIKFIANWLMLVTLPVWGGFAVLFNVLKDASQGNRTAKDMVTGKKWFWES
jgi:hypothetical protein